MRTDREIIDQIETIEKEKMEIIRIYGPDHHAVNTKEIIIGWLEWARGVD
jgi:hypothetical protein